MIDCMIYREYLHAIKVNFLRYTWYILYVTRSRQLPLSLGIQANTQQNDLDEQITQTGQTTAEHSYYGVDGYLMHHTIHVQVPCKVNVVYFKHETKFIEKGYHYLVAY